MSERIDLPSSWLSVSPVAEFPGDALHQRILQNLPDAVLIFDARGHLRWMNLAASTLFGRGEDELLGQSILALAGEPEGGDALTRYVAQRAQPTQVTYLRGDGVELTLSSQVTPLDGEAEQLWLEVVRDITPQHRQQQALRESEARYRQFINTSLEGFGRIDQDNRLIETNARFEAMFGYGPGEMLGHKIEELLAYPEDQEQITSIQRRRRQGEVFAFEQRYRRKDGQPIWVLISPTRMTDEQGNFIGSFAMVADITEQKRIEDDLRLRSQIVEHMAEGVNLVRASDGAIVYANPTFERMFGYAPGEANGLPMTALKSSQLRDPQETVAEIVQHLRATGQWQGEVLNRRKDGASFWSRAVFSSFDHPLHGLVWLAIHENISDRKRVEERLSLALETANVGIWEYQPDSRTVVWDERMFRLYGYEGPVPEEVRQHWRERVHPDDRLRVEEETFRAIREGSTLDVEFRVIWPDGSLHHLRSMGRVRRDMRGQLTQVIGTNWDVSSYKHAREALEQATLVAQAANQAKSGFLTRMSHEIRMPLNAVLGAADLLQDEFVSDQGQEYIRMVRQGGSSLRAIVSSVLDLSAVEAGQIRSERVNLNASELVKSVLDSLELLAEHKGLRLVRSLRTPVPEVLYADEMHLRQVLLNLVSNAIKFCHQGTVEVAVEYAAPGRLWLHVIDTGPGIAPELQPHLFDLYRSRAKVPVEGQGSGLGLQICKTFVELMGGTIEFSSGPQGTRFTIAIPVESPHQVFTLAPRVPMPAQGLSLLVAEDDRVSAQVICRMLTKLGAARVVLARNGQEAVELARTERFDAMIFDKHMPVMDGLEAVRLVRAQEQELGAGPAWISACTADAFVQDRQQCLEAGCDYFLSKPISRDMLAAMLDEFHQRRGLARSLSRARPPHPEGPGSYGTLASSMNILDWRLSPAWLAFSLFACSASEERPGADAPEVPPGDVLTMTATARGLALHLSPARLPSGPHTTVTLPPTAEGPVSVAEADAGVSVSFRLREAQPSAARLERGLVVYRDALAPGVDLMHRVGPHGTEDLVRFATRPAHQSLHYQLDVRAVAGLRLVPGSRTLELLDAQGTPRLRVRPPSGVDARGHTFPASLALRGCAVDTDARPPWGRPVVAPGADTCELAVTWHAEAYPAVVDPAWETTHDMIYPRAEHTATRLPDGRVLMIGGRSQFPLLSVTELFDPTTRTWASSAELSAGRHGHTATRLDDGRVLVIGGQTELLEVVDPIAGTSTVVAQISVRNNHGQARLPDGEILVAGGGYDSSTFSINPSKNFAIKPRASLSKARGPSFAVPLLDGRVLLAGPSDAPSTTAEIYDPATNAWTLTYPPGGDHSGGAGVRLPGGQIVLVGGVLSLESTPSVDVFDPTTSTWTSGPALHEPRSHFALTSLEDGRMLVLGGQRQTGNSPSLLSSTELLDTTTSTLAAPLLVGLASPTATRLDDGTVLVAGGLFNFIPDFGRTNIALLCPGGVCAQGCESNQDCPATYRCIAEVCVGPQGNGSPCQQDDQCQSGHCADGVCCNTACQGTCIACQADLKGQGVTGLCGPILGGLDPKAGCSSGSDPCGPDGFCDGFGLCRTAAPLGSPCPGKVCVDGMESPRLCDGAGQCSEIGFTEKFCYPYGCAGDACATSCTPSSGCGQGGDCVSGVCKFSQGWACANSSQCATGHCVNSVCCEGACDGPCETCQGTKPGICEVVPAGQPSAKCGSNPCGPVCDGVHGDTCGPAPAEGSPCGAPGGQCLGGTCKQGQGTFCQLDSQCSSGHCAQNVCCDSACDGPCETCAGANFGTCTVRPAGQPSPKCGFDLCAPVCDGVHGDTCGPAPHEGTVCQGSQCSGTDIVGHICKKGQCEPVVLAPCEPFPCSYSTEGEATCEPSCNTDSDCFEEGWCVSGVCKDFCPSVGVALDKQGNEIDCHGFDCLNGKCLTECKSSYACIPGYTCVQGSCQPSGAGGQGGASGKAGQGGASGKAGQGGAGQGGVPPLERAGQAGVRATDEALTPGGGCDCRATPAAPGDGSLSGASAGLLALLSLAVGGARRARRRSLAEH